MAIVTEATEFISSKGREVGTVSNFAPALELISDGSKIDRSCRSSVVYVRDYLLVAVCSCCVAFPRANEVA